MKSKFQNFDLGAVEVLSREEQSKVKGGYIPTGGVPLAVNTQIYYTTVGLFGGGGMGGCTSAKNNFGQYFTGTSAIADCNSSGSGPCTCAKPL